MLLRSFPALVGLGALAACGGSNAGIGQVPTVSKVTVSGSNTALNPGQTTQLTAVASDAAGATITNPGIVLWSSSATTIAKVDQNGKVTAVSGGNATITADVAGVKGAFLIRVSLAGGA